MSELSPIDGSPLIEASAPSQRSQLRRRSAEDEGRKNRSHDEESEPEPEEPEDDEHPRIDVRA
jgi:hypothetical protein